MGIHGLRESPTSRTDYFTISPAKRVPSFPRVGLAVVSVCTTAFSRRAQQLRERNEYYRGGNDSLDDPRKVLLSLRVCGYTRGDPGVGSPRKHDTTIPSLRGVELPSTY